MRRAAQEPALIFRLLEGAATFGSANNYADEITRFVEELGLIPPNMREERPQIWRDYQQVLTELGLIVSTRFTDGAIVTQAGLMLLDGLMGYQEMFTTQAFRFQYPNAYKLTIPPNVRERLSAAELEAVNNRVELEMQRGVLIKPAVLLLRVLLELLDRELPPMITTRECVAAMMPTRSNQDWREAVDKLLRIRSGAEPDVEGRMQRHAEEWFALLGATDLFDLNRNVLSLSWSARSFRERATSFCERHEAPSTFWFPEGSNEAQWVSSWFAYYGAPGLGTQWTVPDVERTAEYLRANYPEGTDAEETESESDARNYEAWTGDINLTPFVPLAPLEYAGRAPILTPEAAARIAEGRARQQRSARLHDRIVNLAAARLEAAGFQVETDPLSVDLLARKQGTESILEVKTVTPRNLFPRMRLGVGQLAEYRYRRSQQGGSRSDAVLILSSASSLPAWITEYFSSDIRLGLVGLDGGERFVAHTPGTIESLLSGP